MLRLLNAQRHHLPPVTTYNDLRIERVLDYDDRTLYFSVPVCAMPEEMKLENYIQTKEDEYVIRQMNLNDDSYEITAQLNVEELEGTHFDTFTSTEQTIVQAMNLAFAGTGWRCESRLTKKRTIKKTNASAWEILKQAVKTYRVEPMIDSLNKVVTFTEKRGSDRGVYFSSQLNLKSVGQQAQTTDFYTRIIPVGKDGLTIEAINGGKKYLEDHTYSPKIKTYYWKDERYTVPESLMEDAMEKLHDLAHPVVAYTCDVLDLAKVSRKYSILQFGIGDTVLIIDKYTKIRVQQRIVKMTEYPDNPDQNTCEISNVKLSFEEYAQKYEDTSNTVDNITTDNGTVDGDAIDNIDAAKVQRLDEVIANSAKFTEVNTKILNVSDMLTAANAKIGTLETTKLTATDADLKYATIQNLSAATGRIDILETNALTASSALIHSLTSDVANINTLMFGTASGGSLTTEFSNTVVGLIGDAQIKSAMIQDIVADKITSGRLYTNLVEVVSGSGNLDISDNTIKICDDTQTARVQIGKDAAGDYNIYIWDKNGKLMFDPLYGVQEDGIKRPVIRNDMVSDNANISANKLDITSLFTVINGSKETINSARVFVDADSQTLDVAFKQMTTDVQTAVTKADGVYTLAEAANNNAASALAQVQMVTETVSTQGTQLTEVQGQISSKIWKQDITTAVSELEIGGRNLALDTSNQYSTPFTGFNGYENQTPFVAEVLTDGLKEGDIITVSIVFKYNNIVPTSGHNARFALLQGYGNVNGWNGGFPAGKILEGISGDDEIEIVYQSKLSKQQLENHYWVVDIRCDWIQSGSMQWKRLKIEKGNKPTDWTPAPEDIDSSISALEGTTTTLSNQYTSLNQTLSGLTATVNANTTAITQKADGSTVTTLQNNLTSLEANLNGFKSEVSSTYTTKTDFNNLEIGGRNLFYGTKAFVITNAKSFGSSNSWITSETYNGLTVRRYGYSWNFYRPVISLESGNYVFSGYAKGTNSKIVFMQVNAGDTVLCYKAANITTDWKRYFVLFQLTEKTDVTFYFELRDTGGNIYECGWKLEKGDKPTDWTPAPEDYSTTEQMNSAIKQSADSIKTEVNGTLNNYATTASLELKVSKTDNSQIISMINASADVIKLSSNRFQLDSTYAKINLDGTVAFTGGTIGGFQITSTGINAANGLVGMNITSGWAFHAGNIIAGTDRTVFCVGHEGNVYCHNFWSDNAMIVGGSINVNNNFIVDSSGNLTSKGSADFQCATTYANDFHSRGSIYAASNIDVGSTVGCNDILVKNNAYVREQFYYWYNDSWVRLRDYITAIINGG
jgi:phage minor structural protein